MNQRNSKYKKASEKRVSGAFLALPHDVLQSEAYQSISHTARSLLIEVAMQYKSDNNGMLLLSTRYLKKRGWRSADVITRKKRELLDAQLIFETEKGHRPNKASWYALTWFSLDSNKKYDAGVSKAFTRGAYRNMEQKKVITPLAGKILGTIAP